MRTEWRKKFKCWLVTWACWFPIHLYTTLQCGVITSAAQDDTVFINFPRNLKASRSIAKHLYLPPQEPSFILPEVIDNRMRNIVTRPTQSPDIQLKAPSPSELLSYSYQTIKQTNSTLNSNASNAITVTISSMSCRNAEDEVYFRASVAPLKSRDAPIVEGSASDNCRVKRVRNEFKIDFSGDLFWNCGVQDCSVQSEKFYCLNLRFPTISGLRLKDDMKVVLRCRTQEPTTSHTKRFKVKTIDTSARMAATIASGGHSNLFETQIGLYRKTFGSDPLFDARIPPGGTVILGEEILLRAVVRDGDGWKYSKISDVTINFIENKRQKRIMNSVSILDSNGCLNPEVREICSREQYRVSTLESYLIFEAFMFDNMRETDELIMSVKITGCLEGNDCLLNCPANHGRKTRSLNTPSNNTIDWLDEISFNVVLPQQEHSGFFSQIHMVVAYILSSLILVAIAALLCTIKVVKDQKMQRILI